jgi:hypothetical protein
MTTVDIQVQNGRVRISVGGQPATAGSSHTGIAEQGTVEGATGVGSGTPIPDDTGTGGPASNAIVIGPIVIGGSMPGAPSNGTGSGTPVPDDTGTGGPGGGVLVIGPIVICGGGRVQAPTSVGTINLNP